MRFLALVALLGCGAPDLSGPVTVRLLAPDASGAYALRDQVIESLDSVREVRGLAAHVRGGGVVISEEEFIEQQMQLLTDVHPTTMVEGSRAVEVRFNEQDGVVIPDDYESLIMLSFYHHAERARAVFTEAGAYPYTLEPFVSHFHVRVTALSSWGQTLVTDNAAYAPLADVFLLFPSQYLDDGVPLAANLGVVAHEMSHGVKHRTLHPDGGDPRYVHENWPNAAINSYRSDDEGLADFYGAVTSNNPDFIAESLPGLSLNRDVSVPRRFSASLSAALDLSTAQYNPYPLGSALASWLWRLAGDTPEERIAFAQIVTESIQDLPPRLGPNYRVTDLMDVVLEHLESEKLKQGCAMLAQRLTPDFGRVAACHR
jgi:hypothetical protein